MNPYEILGVSENSDIREIKSAFRKLIKRWHPDRNPDNRETALEKTRQIIYAYKMLVSGHRLDGDSTFVEFDSSRPLKTSWISNLWVWWQFVINSKFYILLLESIFRTVSVILFAFGFMTVVGDFFVVGGMLILAGVFMWYMQMKYRKMFSKFVKEVKLYRCSKCGSDEVKVSSAELSLFYGVMLIFAVWSGNIVLQILFLLGIAGIMDFRLIKCEKCGHTSFVWFWSRKNRF